jgi:hypothetical protein
MRALRNKTIVNRSLMRASASNMHAFSRKMIVTNGRMRAFWSNMRAFRSKTIVKNRKTRAFAEDSRGSGAFRLQSCKSDRLKLIWKQPRKESYSSLYHRAILFPSGDQCVNQDRILTISEMPQ